MSKTTEKIEHLVSCGELAQSIQIADSLLNTSDCVNKSEIDSLKQVALRTYIDFSKTENQVNNELKEQIGNFTLAQKADWEKRNWLEWKLIDGRKMYFKRAVRNLKLRLQNESILPAESEADANFKNFKISEVQKVIAQNSGELTSAKNYKITYTVALQANAVPAGETVKCWLPWPKENHERQSKVNLLSSFPKEMKIAPTTLGQRTIYSEQQAVKDKETIFSIEFTVSTFAQYFDPEKIVCFPYNRNSELYKSYTKEQKPHIVFSEPIKKLADKLAGNETNPLKIIQSFYNYISQNIIWSGALEYSIIKQIPEYVLANNKGDCGMQTLLIMSLARYKGIPVRWQSGFMLHPGKENLHDWCEVYYEGTGWVPLDMSFQNMQSNDIKIAHYYQTGIDAYRLIVNDDISTALFPPKQYMRSEPYDFQRGELEWKGGNLYFDKWDYSINVNYIE